MKRVFSAVIAVAMLFAMHATAFATTPEEAARDIGKYGIMSGYADGSLRLENNVTRAEASKMFAVAGGKLPKGAYENYTQTGPTDLSDFKDMPAGHWAYKFVSHAREYGWIGGFSDRTFRPNDNITCEQAVKIMVCLLNYDDLQKQNERTDTLAYPQMYVYIAQKIGLLNGLTVDLGGKATRGFLAALIANALDIPIVEGTKKGYSLDSPSLYEFRIMNGENATQLKTLRSTLEA